MGRRGVRRRYALLVAYDGAPFAGWQMQPGRETVQETLGKAFLEVGLPPTINGASRTDRGVHARAMVCSTSAHMPEHADDVLRPLRGVLPPSIRLRAVAPVADRFHAQFSSAGKSYRYRLWLARSPGASPLAWRLPGEEVSIADTERFSLGKLQLALAAMQGERTFAGAMAESAKAGLSNLVEARVIRQHDSPEGRLLTLGFRANRFGKYMIRTLVGIAVRCAVGQLDPLALRRQLDSEEPLTQLLAPPEGLVLWKVLYAQGLDPFPWLSA